ncbi:FAD-dependent oxidoreductase [Candidatus Uhrbacteria bacterium]|nr:FAD-dependent oxidoreductase [Candidatus Uhrbacteria bacterium]
MHSEEFDIAIIGAGIVGCATAHHLVRTFPNRSLIVLERREQPGLETSSASSGVIHSGIHLPPTSRKARLAQRGRVLTLSACTTFGVRMQHCGMHVVVSPGDVPHLTGEMRGFFELLRRARTQGVPCTVVPPWNVRKHEPAVRCIFGIHIPDVTVIDVPTLVRAFVHHAATRGAQFRYRTPVHAIERSGTRYHLTTGTNTIRANVVVNAAGLDAARLAKTAGAPEYRIDLYRGEYYEVLYPELRDAVRGLVYPVYRPGSPGLGIHLTKTMDGRLLIGPNAQRIPTPAALTENRTPPEPFLAAVQPFLPTLRREHLRYDHAGIRTKYVNGNEESDFVIALDHADPPLVNCIGIESPGVTAAPAIAEHIAELLQTRIAPC